MDTKVEPTASVASPESTDISSEALGHSGIPFAIAINTANYITVALDNGWTDVELVGTGFGPIPNGSVRQGPVTGNCKGVYYRAGGKKYPGNWPLSISWAAGETLAITGPTSAGDILSFTWTGSETFAPVIMHVQNVPVN